MASPALPETYKKIVPTDKVNNVPHHVAEVPLPKPSANELLVRVEFSPINPSDLANLGGGYVNPNNPKGLTTTNIGNEGAGVVVAVGEELKVPYQIGDKVHLVGPGTWAQYIIVKSETVSKVQGDLPLEQAACHIVNPGTVHYMAHLCTTGGHKTAIHTAGASALGKMLIRYLKTKGVKLINIVRKDEYIEELKKEGADYVLNQNAPDFAEKLKEIAEKEEATIAFDAISGDMPNTILKAMPPGSICYVYGGLSGKRMVEIELGELFYKKSVTGLYLTHHIVDIVKQGKIAEFYKEIQTHLPTIFKSNIQKTFTLDEYKEAVQFYNENSSKGKILFKPN